MAGKTSLGISTNISARVGRTQLHAAPCVVGHCMQTNSYSHPPANPSTATTVLFLAIITTMTSEASKNARSKGRDGMKDTRESDEDSSASSETESTEDEDSSTGVVPPPESIIAGKQIRQHARELLQSSSTERSNSSSIEPDKNNINNSAKQQANNTNNKYQSYHDAPPPHSSARVSSSSSTFTTYLNSDATMVSPPWGSSDHGNSDDYGMSMTDIATMAFSCVAHCLTEGYRAASNYYGNYPQEQYTGATSPVGAQSYYHQVASYHNESYNHVRTNMNSYNDDHQPLTSSIPSKNGYDISDSEVMERGITSSSESEKSRQTPGEQPSRKEEWETVQVPSSYQGGRVGGRY